MSKNIENKLVPKLRFPEFLNEANWVEDTLVNIAGFRRGSFPQPYGLPKWYDDINGMPFIQVYDVGDDFRLKPQTKNKISKIGAEQSVFISKGTVIITIQGSIGRVAITQYDAYIDRTLLLFEEFYIELDKTFFAYLLFLLFEIEKLKAPGGIIKTITKEVLSQFVVKLPSPKEQQKIAACLSSLDEVIAAENQKLDILKDHKKGLLQNLFPQEGETVPKYRFKEFENSGEWVEKTLGEIGEPLMCKRIFKEETTPNPNNGIPFYKIGTFGRVADSYITKEIYEEYKSKYSFPKIGDILISASGTIGRLVIYDGSPAYFQDSNIIWLGHNEKQVLNSFLFYCYSNLEWQTSDGGIISRLYNSDFKRMTIFFPKNQKEQDKIADTLSSIDDLINAQNQKLETLKLHKKGLLQGLFPGVNET
ncbi:MAG TPA: restriction endonuclease subunit S [bacterium]|jgi:type I restriction enzyme S subunit|nr:restriction endonuclease subunit S [bacterium]HRQ68860.1 restriction endonuclease subunit S [bacterium]